MPDDDVTSRAGDFFAWCKWRAQQPRPPATIRDILDELRVLGGVGIVEVGSDVVPGLLDEPGPKFEIVPPQMMACYDLVLTRRSELAADAATVPLVEAAIESISLPDIVVLVPSLLPPPPPLSAGPTSPPPLPPTPSLPQSAPDHTLAVPPARHGELTFRVADVARFYRYLDGKLGEQGLFPPPAKPWRDGDRRERVGVEWLLAYLLENFDEQPSLGVFLERARGHWPKRRYWVTRGRAQTALAHPEAVDRLGPPKEAHRPKSKR
jgi:hypothetical protein